MILCTGRLVAIGPVASYQADNAESWAATARLVPTRVAHGLDFATFVGVPVYGDLPLVVRGYSETAVSLPLAWAPSKNSPATYPVHGLWS